MTAMAVNPRRADDENSWLAAKVRRWKWTTGYLIVTSTLILFLLLKGY